MRPRILVLGAGGHIGYHIATGLGDNCDVVPVVGRFLPHGMRAKSCDITIEDDIAGLVSDARPDVVVNAAALTDADLCQKKPELAQKINVDGALNVAKACARSGAYLIHYSTDLVFDGIKGMYTEEDEINPLNVYARSKADSENITLGANRDTAILRTAIVYGPGSGNGKSFFEASVDRARNNEKVRLFTDQYRSFLYIGDSAKAAIALFEARSKGVYHVAGPDRLSRCDFMLKVFQYLNVSTDSVESISLKDLPDMAPRPADCSLDSSKITKATGWRPSSFNEAMEKIKKRIRF